VIHDSASKPAVKAIRRESEIRWVSRLDASIYGAESVDYEGLCGWWRAYPKGIYALWKDSRIVGAVGIWPLRREAYDRLVAGQMDETDIKAEDIWGGNARESHPYWYFADIVLEEEYHKTRERLALILMEESVRNWLGRGNLTPEIHVCALGFEEEGESLLGKFNFRPPGGRPVRSPRGKPVYARTLTTCELLEALDYLSHLRKRRRGAGDAPAPARRYYDVFISYRREHHEFARLIHGELEEMGYSAFLDVADRCTGRFDEALYESIRNTPHFVVILSPGCLERCPEGEDYFLAEIAHALKADRHVLPVVMTDFKFPADLPAELRTLPLQQHVRYAPELPDFTEATIEQIADAIESAS
jgi:hypothetical protein